MTDMERFQSKYVVEAGGKLTNGEPCWLWTAGKFDSGYGQFSMRGRKNFRAHKWIYQACIGVVEEGKQLHHECERKHCVNPRHLVQKTPFEHDKTKTSGVTALNVIKTHCPKGHPYTGTYVRKDGKFRQRRCIVCENLRAKLYQRRMRG